MKNAYLSIIIILLLIFPSLNVVVLSLEEPSNMKLFQIEEVTCFSELKYKSEGEYISVDLDEASTFLMKAGKPMLPVYTKTYTFPIGTKILDVNVTIPVITQEFISRKIKPSPEPILKNSVEKPNTRHQLGGKKFEDASVYSSPDLFPDKWYDYNIGRGLDGKEPAIFLTIRFYPVRYSPAENILYSTNNIDLEITYEEPEESIIFSDDYDMVIIAPRKFCLKLLPLVIHKNKNDISALLKTTEGIYDKYDGRDNPEKIKYFIKYAVEEWGVKYVLLVGGLKGQRNDWYVPVRKTCNDDGWESGYISDLYYADIYDGMGDFSSWDTNGNDIFAEWYYEDELRDIIDYYPDVNVGRLACRNENEVSIAVDKIITYENRLKLLPWNNKMIIAAGDTFPSPNSNYYEGEIETNLSASYMEATGFAIEKLWASEGTLRNHKIIRTIRKGAAFVHFAGHGNPFFWGTHPPNDYDTWINGLRNFQMDGLRNGYKLPVVVVGGCHNSQFNVTLLNIFKGFKNEGLNYLNYTFWFMDWVPECWAWKMISTRNGGAIATIGNTGLGYGYGGESTLNGLGGWIEPRFFYNVGIQEATQLGQAHSKTISDFIDNFDVNDKYGQIERKTIEQWVLLGDPSLNIN